MKIFSTRRFSVTALAALLTLAGCGNSASAGTGAKPSPSPSSGQGAAFRGASGLLVQVKGMTLILTGPNGDLTVQYSASTALERTATSTVADIAPGQCVVATGQKDATGVFLVASLQISPKPTSGCRALGPGAGGGRRNSPDPSASPRPSPSPGASPRPNGAPPVFGEVTAVTNNTITVTSPTGTTQSLSVSPNIRVARTSPATAEDLVTGECIAASGARDPSGVVQAVQILISPPDASGQCNTRAFGRGGRGPGGGGGGGGGGIPGGGANGSTATPGA